MKTTLSLFAALPLVLAAQEAPTAPERSPEPEWDIVERFEQMQREARESGDIEHELREEIRQKLEIRGLPDEKKPGKDPDRPRRDADPKIENQLLELLQPEMKKPGLPRESTLDSAAMAQPWRIGLGVEPIESFPRSHLDIPKDSGVRVSMVASDGPAAKAGIKVNDILLSANGEKILSLLDLKYVVLEPGSEGKPVTMELLHEGKRKTVEVQPRGPQPLEDKGRKAAPGPELSPMIEIQRRLDQQQKEIGKLRREVERLRESLKRE